VTVDRSREDKGRAYYTRKDGKKERKMIGRVVLLHLVVLPVVPLKSFHHKVLFKEVSLKENFGPPLFFFLLVCDNADSYTSRIFLSLNPEVQYKATVPSVSYPKLLLYQVTTTFSC